MKKIYTRTGDDGTTSLFGGSRVTKNHPRIEAYGTVDETNANIGLALAFMDAEGDAALIREILTRVQQELFVLGADLATQEDTRSPVPRIEPAQVEDLESDVDRLSEDLPPLEHFILPGGTQAASVLHVARTACRRAERLTVAAADRESINREAVRYLNRLSDLLFVTARWLNHRAGTAEEQWLPEQDDT